MQSSVAKNAPQRTISAPASAWLYRDLSCHIVFVIVDVQPQGPANVVLNQLSKVAFAMESAEFDDAFQRIKDSKIPYGDSPRAQDNMQGPGVTAGAKGDGKAVYFKDPNGHVLEIQTY